MEIEDGNDEPGNDEEPSLGWTDQEAKLGSARALPEIDAEQDDCDDEPDQDGEPSLGSLSSHGHGDQAMWGRGLGSDIEDEHDGAEPSEDSEPSLGSLDQRIDQEVAWCFATFETDLELDHSESGIGDRDGLLEQIGMQDWQHGAMA